MGGTWRFNDIAVVGDDVFGRDDNGNVYKIGATVATTPVWASGTGIFNKIVGGNTKLYGIGTDKAAYRIEQNAIVAMGGNWRFKDIAVVGDVLYGLDLHGTSIYKVTGTGLSPTPFDEPFATLTASYNHIIGGGNSLYAYNNSNAYRINVPN